MTKSNAQISGPGLWRISLIGACLMALAPLSIDMYLPAFSAIAFDLHGSQALVQISLSIFFAGITLGQLFYGPVSDRVGRKKPLVFGLGLFALSTLGCFFVTNVQTLILLRFLQALGASAGMVISQVIVPDVFKDHRKAGQVFSALMLVMGIAPIVAPTLGGFILVTAGWRAIFAVLLGIGVLVLGSVLAFLPETAGPNPEVRISQSFKVYGSLLKNSGYRRIALTRSVANAGMFVYITASPFVFLRILNLSAFSFGCVFGANALAMMIGGLANGLLLKKHTPEKLFSVAVLLVMVFGVLSVVSGFLAPTLVTLVLPLVGFLFGLGMIMPSSTALALKGHGKHTGSASALLGSLQFAVAFAASGAVSLAPEGGVLSMTLGIGVCGLGAAALHFAGRTPKGQTPVV